MRKFTKQENDYYFREMSREEADNWGSEYNEEYDCSEDYICSLPIVNSTLIYDGINITAYVCDPDDIECNDIFEFIRKVNDEDEADEIAEKLYNSGYNSFIHFVLMLNKLKFKLYH